MTFGNNDPTTLLAVAEWARCRAKEELEVTAGCPSRSRRRIAALSTACTLERVAATLKAAARDQPEATDGSSDDHAH